MSTRWQPFAVTLCLTLASTSALHADMYRWDNGEVIPGTEGITPGLHRFHGRFAPLFRTTGVPRACAGIPAGPAPGGRS